jgi:hypothetical protein
MALWSVGPVVGTDACPTPCLFAWIGPYACMRGDWWQEKAPAFAGADRNQFWERLLAP